MFKIIKFHKRHIPILTDICNRINKYPMPDLSSPLFIIRGTITDNEGRIVGAGFIRLTAEAIILVEPELPRGLRSRITHLLFNAGMKACAKKGLDNIHAFVYDMPAFTNFLVKRLGFKKVEGQALSIKV